MKVIFARIERLENVTLVHKPYRLINLPADVAHESADGLVQSGKFEDYVIPEDEDIRVAILWEVTDDC